MKKLVFAEERDVRAVRGKLTFGANGLSHRHEAIGLPPMAAVCPVPQADGSYDLIGVRAERHKPWQILKCRTADGRLYENLRVVYESRPGSWVGFTSITWNPDEGKIIAWRPEVNEPSHAVWAFVSTDGERWELLHDEPIFHDHDAFTVRWDRDRGEYIRYQNTMQPRSRRYGDNVGDQVCRVLTIQTSPDGIHWSPGGDAGYSRGPHHPAERLITPDEHDPEDLQFYLFQAFSWAGRHVGMMLNYAPCPQEVNPRFPHSLHGPSLSGEWWLSDDGVTWRRKWREVFAPGEAPEIIRHEPMLIDGRNLWTLRDGVYSLSQDRMFFAGSLCNAEFSTPPFTMGNAIVLDAVKGFLQRPGRGWEQAYVMAELLDEEDRVIPGYERERCICPEAGEMLRTLSWGKQTGADLSGRRISVRLCFRDARIHALTVG